MLNKKMSAYLAARRSLSAENRMSGLQLTKRSFSQPGSRLDMHTPLCTTASSSPDYMMRAQLKSRSDYSRPVGEKREKERSRSMTTNGYYGDKPRTKAAHSEEPSRSSTNAFYGEKKPAAATTARWKGSRQSSSSSQFDEPASAANVRRYADGSAKDKPRGDVIEGRTPRLNEDACMEKSRSKVVYSSQLSSRSDKHAPVALQRSNSMVQIYRDQEQNRTVCTISFGATESAHGANDHVPYRLPTVHRSRLQPMFRWYAMCVIWLFGIVRREWIQWRGFVFTVSIH